MATNTFQEVPTIEQTLQGGGVDMYQVVTNAGAGSKLDGDGGYSFEAGGSGPLPEDSGQLPQTGGSYGGPPGGGYGGLPGSLLGDGGGWLEGGNPGANLGPVP
jgi:hypothetical protein